MQEQTRKRLATAARISVYAALMGTLIGTELYVHNRYTKALRAQSEAAAQLGDAQTALTTSAQTAHDRMAGLTVDDVPSQDDLDSYQAAIEQAMYDASLSDEAVDDESGMNFAKVEKNTETLRNNTDQVKAGTDDLKKADDELSSAIALKDRMNARDELTKAIDSAKASLDVQVSDSATTDALKQAIDDAEKASGTDPKDADTTAFYTNHEPVMQKAVDDVSASHQKYEEEQAAKAAAEARTKAAKASRHSSGNESSASASNGVWSPSYHNAYGTDSAASDGSLTQWDDNYFIAHSWSANGKAIASKPEYVNINGKTYKYTGSMSSRIEADATDSLAFARQNGGIGFQTCTGGGNVIVTHYEPVN